MNTETQQPTDASAIDVCAADDIVPGTGVCALVQGRHVAIFRVGPDQFHAIDNVDPQSGASVLSRGLIGSLGERVVVASPLYKNHFDLRTGECLEAPQNSVRAHAVRVQQGRVCVALSG
ncbi:nitrite reductase small subunit NirD [Paracidovorax wautersii]|uniref:Nitrite reductase (NADH) small subunit n=1 Tax=Paracidovorax wautersii TaxID=1177982 RepID=A0A1I2A227_9BURK|nr:nitrite reductase small subunit NirD [Paracidovorax wautersii]SFE37837.1 nitrite reductase (NADH) small subunit [Paracidovorax wautersii]